MEETYIAPAKIKVIGVGGGGNNAVNRMIISGLKGAEFVAVNTDKLVLDANKAGEKLILGEKLTKGLGAGAKPEIGAAAAEEAKEKLKEIIRDVDMLFITAGMGGGTGTGAAPIIAQIAHEMDILTVGIVTKPFEFEGTRRMKNAIEGIEKMKDYVDTLLVIPNEKLVEIYSDMSQSEAYDIADEVLRNAVKGITEIITRPTVINLDFADVKTIMKGSGLAHMGIGESKGTEEGVVLEAVRNAVDCPLIETNISGAKGVIINFITPSNIKLKQINEATNLVRNVVDPDANIIFGQGFDDDNDDTVQVTLIATGFDGARVKEEKIELKTENFESENLTQQQNSSNKSQEIVDFENEIKNNPAYKNMNPACLYALDTIINKVKIMKDQTVPAFLKESVKNDLVSAGIDPNLV